MRAIATGLHALGVRSGDPVAILIRNRPEFHLADTAALHLGATPFSLYATEPLEQMLALMKDSGARVLITEEEFCERGSGGAERAGVGGRVGGAVATTSSTLRPRGALSPPSRSPA